jgi:hypothetical protein
MKLFLIFIFLPLISSADTLTQVDPMAPLPPDAPVFVDLNAAANCEPEVVLAEGMGISVDPGERVVDPEAVRLIEAAQQRMQQRQSTPVDTAQ